MVEFVQFRKKLTEALIHDGYFDEQFTELKLAE